MGPDCACLSLPPRWRVPGARGPGRSPEALERLSAAAGRSPGTLAHPDQRAAPRGQRPALSLSGMAPAQRGPRGAGASTQPSHECVARLHGVDAPPPTTCFVRVRVTVGLSSREGLWRSIFTYANFLLPDSLPRKYANTRPGQARRGLLLLSPASPGCPVPLGPQGGGRIRGGSEEENVSKQEKDKKKTKKTKKEPLL